MTVVLILVLCWLACIFWRQFVALALAATITLLCCGVLYLHDNWGGTAARQAGSITRL